MILVISDSLFFYFFQIGLGKIEIIYDIADYFYGRSAILRQGRNGYGQGGCVGKDV